MTKQLAAAIAILAAGCSGIGEGFICAHAIDGIARNPDNAKTLRTYMILGCALDETTAIYALLISLLCLFL